MADYIFDYTLVIFAVLSCGKQSHVEAIFVLTQQHVLS
jgi:hypothetical protein